MQGYILKVIPAREEDCVVFVLTREALVKSYRFYGARHSTILTGFKVDFELEGGATFLPHLRHVLQLGFGWMAVRERLGVWQEFCRLAFEHLEHVGALEAFYFELFEWASAKMSRQNPRRVAVEAFLELLAFEGRLDLSRRCFLCGGEIGGGAGFVEADLAGAAGTAGAAGANSNLTWCGGGNGGDFTAKIYGKDGWDYGSFADLTGGGNGGGLVAANGANSNLGDDFAENIGNNNGANGANPTAAAANRAKTFARAAAYAKIHAPSPTNTHAHAPNHRAAEAEKIALARAFVPTHAHCSGRREIAGVGELFARRSTAHLDDDVVAALYAIMCEGF